MAVHVSSEICYASTVKTKGKKPGAAPGLGGIQGRFSQIAAQVLSSTAGQRALQTLLRRTANKQTLHETLHRSVRDLAYRLEVYFGSSSLLRSGLFGIGIMIPDGPTKKVADSAMHYQRLADSLIAIATTLELPHFAKGEALRAQLDIMMVGTPAERESLAKNVGKFPPLLRSYAKALQEMSALMKPLPGRPGHQTRDEMIHLFWVELRKELKLPSHLYPTVGVLVTAVHRAIGRPEIFSARRIRTILSAR
jgi:hypothetical protein